MNCHEHEKWLCNRDFSDCVCLWLYDAGVTSSILLGGEVLSLIRKDSEYIFIIQRRIIRLDVGWWGIADEDWEVSLWRIKQNVSTAKYHEQMVLWCHRFYRTRWGYTIHDVHNFRKQTILHSCSMGPFAWPDIHLYAASVAWMSPNIIEWSDAWFLRNSFGPTTLDGHRKIPEAGACLLCGGVYRIVYERK